MGSAGLLGLASLSGLPGMIHEGLTGEKERRKREAEARLAAIQAKIQSSRYEIMRRRMAVEANLQNLAMGAADIYNQMAAGRQLPPDAVVIGGQRRTDLLQQLAMNMADGAFSPQGM